MCPLSSEGIVHIHRRKTSEFIYFLRICGHFEAQKMGEMGIARLTKLGHRGRERGEEIKLFVSMIFSRKLLWRLFTF